MRMPIGYSAASEDWVSGVLLGLAKAPYSAVPVGGFDSLWERLVIEIGGKDSGHNYNVMDRMAMLYGTVNNLKGQFFKNKLPIIFERPSNGKVVKTPHFAMLETKRKHRSVSYCPSVRRSGKPRTILVAVTPVAASSS